MIPVQIGVALQSERLELIRTIARNIVGEPAPPPRPGPAGSTGLATIPQSADPSQWTNETSPSGSDALQDEYAVDRSRVSHTSQSLIGLRPPLSTIAQPAAYAAAIARLAQSLTQQAGTGSPAATSTLTVPASTQSPAGLVEPDGMAADPYAGQSAADQASARLLDQALGGMATRTRTEMIRLAAGRTEAAPSTASSSLTEADSAKFSPDHAPVERRTTIAADPPAAVEDAGWAYDSGSFENRAAEDRPAAATILSDPADGEAAAAEANRKEESASPQAAFRRSEAAPGPASLTQSPQVRLADGDPMSFAAVLQSATAREFALADRGIQSEMIERSLLALGLGAGANANPAPQAERAGVIASFILNAHFLPGWPPLRPIENVEAKALVLQAAAETDLSKSEIDALLYLANFGLNREQLARILKLLAKARRRSKLLDAIATFFSNFGTLMCTLQDELELLVEELRAERQLSLGAAPGKRSRIDLR